jgi:hypothetical protein
MPKIGGSTSFFAEFQGISQSRRVQTAVPSSLHTQVCNRFAKHVIDNLTMCAILAGT